MQSSLLQHSNRAVYQASIWARSLQEIQNTEGFGWKNIEGSWKPVWTILSEVVKASRELIKCGCRAKPLCSRRCKCQVQDCLVLLSASAVATVNTNTSHLMHIFHQYNIFMKILSTILKDRKDTSKFARKSV